MTPARAFGIGPASDPAGRAALNAPLFRNLMEEMQDDRRRVVLDLGPARPETVALLGRYRCRLDIADLADGLDALNGATEPEAMRAALSASLPRPRAEATSVVLCWDLLNYLERPALRAVMGEILGRLGPGALAHALIAYSTPRMPVRPARIVPIEDHRLWVVPATGEEKAAPRYSPDELARCMPGYIVERAMLLKNGMQEFLFRH
ncbi:MAG: hypothetical protein ACNA8G_09345 [Gammaproteobacteria bacterium]